MAASFPAPRVLRRPWLLLGLAIAVLMTLLAALAPAVAPHKPLEQLAYGMPGGVPAGPGPRLPFGADSLGRDVLSRVLYGARISLTVGISAMLLATAIGLAVGVSAGYFGGVVDGALMRVTDVVMAFPVVLLAVVMAAVLPDEQRRRLWPLAFVIGFVNWAGAARIFRSETLSLRERLYVEAARVLGASHGRILLRHVLPHLLPTVLVVASLSTATTILLDAGLSFLNLGVPAPAPTWGSMLRDAQEWYSVAPWLVVFPGLAVVLTVAAFNLIAFDLRRELSVRG